MIRRPPGLTLGRSSAASDVYKSQRRLNAGQPVLDWQEQATPALARGETMMVGLRLLDEGVNRAAFRARFGLDVADVYPDILAELTATGLIEVTPHCVRLTPAAVLIGNRVFARFLPS